MPSLWLDKCCVCIPLRVGCFFIGYLLAIYKTIAMFVTTLNLTLMKTVMQQHPEVATPSMNLLKFLLYAVAFMYAMQMMMSINLLVGLHKNKLKHIRKFYLVYPFLLAIFVILFAISLGSFGSEYSAFEWYLIIPDVLVALFEIYSIFIVKRCYLELKAKSNENRGTVYSKPGDV